MMRQLCLYPCAVIAAAIAVFIGFISTAPVPEGTLFATVIPIMHGYLPPSIFGDWKTSPVPAVPDDLNPAARPKGEMFLKLPSGSKMPANGLGLCCRASAYDAPSVTRSVLWYLLKGGRHLDTAQLYLNHEAVGKGIAAAVARGVPRKEIFVTTKLAPRFYSGDDPAASVAQWLKELGVEYIDLVLLHHPTMLGGMPFAGCPTGTAQECRKNAWVALSALRDRGVIKDLGVSNFGIGQVDELRALKLAPVAVNQVQFNPWAPDWQHDVVKHCQQHGVAVTAWAPFQGTMMQNAAAFTVQTLQEIAAAKRKTVPQVMLRWALQKKAIVIPGTGNPSHMDENLDVYAFKLSEKEMSAIDGLRSDPKAKDFVAMGFEKTE
jgi:diketogulonate reductase-like aldo/keto reductase